MNGPFPEDSAERKTYPLYGGVLAYFPAALAKVAHHSYLGNEKHNPGQPLHWARGKSDDHLEAAARHLTEGDLTGAAWRVLAALQLQCEAEGAPMAPGARNIIPDADVAKLLAEGIALADGFPVTGSPSHDLSPAVQELIERSDEDAPTAHLKAGEAVQ